MEHGLFDDDYADNSFDRNLPALFDETDIQDNERFLLFSILSDTKRNFQGV